MTAKKTGSSAESGGLNSAAGWDAFRIFLAVAETASLSGAGRKLKLSHATVGRHIAALEKELGAKLFIREPVGYALTAAGERLRAEVEPMATAAERAARAALAEDGEPRGVVRISVAGRELPGNGWCRISTNFTRNFPPSNLSS